ncbi:hypothetical protein [Acinetobacter sp.]|uniref:hypothetical protein n=1 Tax=Acinetobacter sp. TaxID=472 RepID=UPI00388EBC29
MAKKDMPEGIKEDWRTIYLCETREQALAVINYSYSCRISTYHDAMIIGDPDHCIPKRFFGSVAVSKADAMQYVISLIDNEYMISKDGKQLALQLYICERVEKGRYDRKTHKAKPDRTIRICWIG